MLCDELRSEESGKSVRFGRAYLLSVRVRGRGRGRVSAPERPGRGREERSGSVLARERVTSPSL